MNSGSTATLRALGAQLTDEAEDTERLVTKITNAAHDGALDAYERKAMHVFQSRWGEVKAVLKGLAAASRDVSAELSQLASSLDQAQRPEEGRELRPEIVAGRPDPGRPGWGRRART